MCTVTHTFIIVWRNLATQMTLPDVAKATDTVIIIDHIKMAVLVQINRDNQHNVQLDTSYFGYLFTSGAHRITPLVFGNSCVEALDAEITLCEAIPSVFSVTTAPINSVLPRHKKQVYRRFRHKKQRTTTITSPVNLVHTTSPCRTHHIHLDMQRVNGRGNFVVGYWVSAPTAPRKPRIFFPIPAHPLHHIIVKSLKFPSLCLSRTHVAQQLSSVFPVSKESSYRSDDSIPKIMYLEPGGFHFLASLDSSFSHAEHE